MREPSELWIPRRRLPNVTALLCFPSAGGTAASFSDWKPLALPDFEIVPLKLPGRGVRLREPMPESMTQLVEAMGQALGPILPASYCVFGQCLGGILAYEFVRWIGQQSFAKPKHLFVSGCGAPLTEARKVLSQLDEEGLIRQLRAWGGTPDEMLERRDFLELMLPSVRADLRLFEHYTFAPEPQLTIPITALRGVSDSHVNPESLVGWRDCTTGPCVAAEVEGAHFPAPAVLLAAIRARFWDPSEVRR